MKGHVVLDKDGKIVTVGYLDRPELELKDYLTPRAGPEAGEGQTVVELDVPNEYVRLPLADYIERLQYDIQTKRSEMKPKKQ